MSLKMEIKVESFNKLLIFLVFFIFLFFLLMQIICPLCLSNDSFKDLSGSSLIDDNNLEIKEMGFPCNGIYSIGDRLCHQKADRSFFINGNQMPFCARCTAIWLGITIGVFIMIFIKIELTIKFLLIFLLSLIPLGIDGVCQLFGFWESSNLIRFLTGLFTGIISGIAIGLIIYEFNKIIKKRFTKV